MASINDFFANVPADVLASLQGLDLSVITQPLQTSRDAFVDRAMTLRGHSRCLHPMAGEPHILSYLNVELNRVN